MSDIKGVSLSSQILAGEDARLVARCRSGDASAWNEIVDRYQRLIITIPRRAGLSEDAAADIFQDVFVALFEKLDELEQPEKLRSWLVTTAKFKTWGLVRRERGNYAPATEEELDAELAAIPDKAALADDALIELEDQHIIRNAMRQLEEKCRTILTMLYLAEPAASYADVGRAIGVGESSISPMRSRCLKKLGKHLEVMEK